jgi:pimeloyl-ACP methyl ester carboxylesterase
MSSRSHPGHTTDSARKIHRPAASTSHNVLAGDLRLHYLDYGTRGLPPMLCIHGSAAHAHWYDFVAPGFIPKYHVHALDLRGHGDSEHVYPPEYNFPCYAADVAKAVDALALKDFVLIGHSMGGMVSLSFAATYPGYATHLIIVDSATRMNEAGVANMRKVGAREGASYATNEEFIARYKLRPGGTIAAPEVLSHLAHLGARQWPDGRWRPKFDRNVYATREPFDGLPHWANIKIPALWIRGDRSKRISDELVALVRTVCPQVKVADVPDSDHHVTLDNPDGFVTAVSAFLAEH